MTAIETAELVRDNCWKNWLFWKNVAISLQSEINNLLVAGTYTGLDQISSTRLFKLYWLEKEAHSRANRYENITRYIQSGLKDYYFTGEWAQNVYSLHFSGKSFIRRTRFI
jgi:hypothetical protein